jgi:hypothetical protein
MGVVCQRKDPAALLPGKTLYPLHRRLGGLQGRSGRARKFSPPPGFQPQTFQAVASRYTDRAIPGRSQSLRCTMLYRLLGYIRRTSCELVWNRTLHFTWCFVSPILQQHCYRHAHAHLPLVTATGHTTSNQRSEATSQTRHTASASMTELYSYAILQDYVSFKYRSNG